MSPRGSLYSRLERADRIVARAQRTLAEALRERDAIEAEWAKARGAVVGERGVPVLSTDDSMIVRASAVGAYIVQPDPLGKPAAYTDAISAWIPIGGTSAVRSRAKLPDPNFYTLTPNPFGIFERPLPSVPEATVDDDFTLRPFTAAEPDE